MMPAQENQGSKAQPMGHQLKKALQAWKVGVTLFASQSDPTWPMHLTPFSLRTRLSSFQLILFSFVGVILAGALLLMLPGMARVPLSFLQALYTATSAVCVTGLVVLDTGQVFTPLGQGVLAFLIQIGGLGYLTMAVFLGMIFGQRIGLTERKLIKEFWNLAHYGGVLSFLRRLALFVLALEAVGSLLLTWSFAQTMPWGQALRFGAFHAVSAFNNAGFSLFSDSIMSHRDQGLVVLTLSLLIVTGGIGFFVVSDLTEKARGLRRRFRLHSKLVLWGTLLLILVGMLLYYYSERNFLLADPSLSGWEKFLMLLFTSVTARTAGFNVVDYNLMQPGSLLVTLGLMWIGASPGSTGGGIKNTTFFVILLNIWSSLRGKSKSVLFGRAIPQETINRAMVVATLSIFYIGGLTLLLVDVEKAKFLPTLFEVVSAFSTVGLSLGTASGLSYSADFSSVGQGLIVLTMLVGRVGPLTLFMALLKTRDEPVGYPQEDIMIG